MPNRVAAAGKVKKTWTTVFGQVTCKLQSRWEKEGRKEPTKEGVLKERRHEGEKALLALRQV